MQRKENEMARKAKPKFYDFLKTIHGITYFDYQFNLTHTRQEALQTDYIIRYGTPINWNL